MAMAKCNLDGDEVETWPCDGAEGYVPGGAGGEWYGYGGWNDQRTSRNLRVSEKNEGGGVKVEEGEGVRAVVVKRLKAQGNNSEEKAHEDGGAELQWNSP